MQDSDDSEEEASHEEPSVTSWSELPIIEHVDLSSVDMSEKDLEMAFSQLSLAFSCDQYALKQRLQAEEHARNLAEENIHQELSRGRETLEALKSLCSDRKRSSILQRLELSLDILSGTVERISNTAEVLGAVHQEARVSQAVELMVAHVESQRRRHNRHEAELEETKRILQQQQDSCKNKTFTDSENKRRKGSNQSTLRRRISASIISGPTQEKKMRDSRKQDSSCKKPSPRCLSPSLSFDSSCCVVSKEDSSMDDRQPDPPEDPQSELYPTLYPETLASKQDNTIKSQSKKYWDYYKNMNPFLDAFKKEHMSKEAFSKGKIVPDTQNSGLSRCRWAYICSNLFVLLCVIMLTRYMWELYDGEVEL